MGRSRGGLTTKIHALVDADGLPITLKTTEGQAQDGNSADDMLETLGEGTTLLGDRAYDSDERRQKVAERGACSRGVPPARILTNLAPGINRRMSAPITREIAGELRLLEARDLLGAPAD